MQRMDLVGVRVEMPANTPLMILREVDAPGRLLPIYIGSPEAAAIHSAMEGIVPPRPMTHDLLLDVVEAIGARPVGVIVTEVRDHTFHASLRIEDAEGSESTLSCRQSIACAMGVRCSVPKWASFTG
ncbi:MAG: bifunctional nuclease family protein, partial [Ilumatobacter sp.]